LPVRLVMISARYRNHVNASILHATDKLFTQNGVRDITIQVRRAWRHIH
jgi:hypothetical protein